MNKKILWIASYPKSGNTWMRAIISSLFFTNQGKFSFEYLKYISTYEYDKRFDFIKKLNKNDYNNLSKLEIISKYWVDSQNNIEIDGDFHFLKTHHACIKFNNYPFTTPLNTLGLIYLVRDPRDIAISYSKHLGFSIDKTISIMIKKNATASYNGERADELRIYQSRWDVHIESWEKLNVPTFIIRYEDLLNDTKNTLYELVKFFEINFQFKFNNINNKVENIFHSTSFDIFQKHEKKYNFREASKNSRFFRKGVAGQWENNLTANQLNIIESNFKDMMKKYNYN